MNHIVIIGFMGSGKTRVGKKLSRDLELPFVDVDRVVAKKMNLSIKEIYQRFGEPYYRALETMTIKALLDDPEKKVVSLSAGLPLQEQNQTYLKQLGTVLYIRGSAEVLSKRLESTGNTSLMPEGGNQEDKIRRMLKQRDPVYAGFADIQVETGVKPFEELILEIEEKLRAAGA